MQTEPACAMERVHCTEFMLGSIHTLLGEDYSHRKNFCCCAAGQKSCVWNFKTVTILILLFFFFKKQLPNIKMINFITSTKYVV